MRSLGQEHVPPDVPGVDTLSAGLAHPRGPVPADLVRSAHRLYLELCASQTRVRLLHGDLHHDNVLLDSKRGWLAIDPKGRLGELEYEAGALLRNPWDRPDVFADPVRLRARLACLERELPVDPRRVRSWAFAQAVLAALWGVEDGLPEPVLGGWIALARTLQEPSP
jgi:streptomycin 6-kinase